MFIVPKEVTDAFLEKHADLSDERDKAAFRSVLGYIALRLYEFVKVQQNMNPIELDQSWPVGVSQFVTTLPDMIMQVVLPSVSLVGPKTGYDLPYPVTKENYEWAIRMFTDILASSHLKMEMPEEAPGVVVITGPKLFRFK